MVQVKHDITFYAEDSPYYKEAILMMENYVRYISDYSTDKSGFLELGIGHGYTISLLRERFDKLVVVDAELKFIERYQPLFPDVDFVHEYFENYHSQAKIANVGMGFVLELVANPVSILEYYASMLVPRGRIFISVSNAASLHRLIARCANLLSDIKEPSVHTLGFNYKRHNTYVDWLAIFESAKLRIVASHGLFLKPFSTAQLDTLNLDDGVYRALCEVAKGLPKIANGCFFALER